MLRETWSINPCAFLPSTCAVSTLTSLRTHLHTQFHTRLITEHSAGQPWKSYWRASWLLQGAPTATARDPSLMVKQVAPRHHHRPASFFRKIISLSDFSVHGMSIMYWTRTLDN